MDLDCDLSMIKSEDLLRRMWQKSEDDHRKREIRSHLYKLREERLRDLYQGDIMSGNAGPGFGKDPLTPSHGDALVDQSFQSLKSKEIRDSMSPIQDLKFQSMTLNQPNNTGWDVQTSSEVSPDGRAYRTDTVATTDGVERVHGGVAEFKGRNEQHSSASHQGDDKNFVKKASESSNTHLHEKVVIGDENSGRTEMKMSSTTSSSSSQVISSSSTVEYDDGVPRNNPPRYIMDNSNQQHVRDQYDQQQQVQQQRLQQELHHQQQRHQQELQQRQHELQQHQQEHTRHTTDQTNVKQHQQQYTEQYNRNRQETNTSTNVETQKHHEENKRFVDMDKASPEYQRHVQYLMSQPGEVISNTVEYPKPNVKMITTVKRLPDGTIVKNKRYETEELTPSTDSTRQRSTSTTNRSNTQHTTQTRSTDQQQRTHRDVVDNAETVRRNQETNTQSNKHLVESYPKDRYPDETTNVATTFSTVKKSSRRFSTETTSETIQEVDDHKNRDFTTHGFPSVKPNKPTQEYPTDRPHPSQYDNDFTTQGFPSVKPNKPTQEYPTDRPHPARHDNDFSTQGFPSVKPNKLTQEYPSERPHAVRPDDDFTTHGFPSVKPTKPTQEYPTDRPQTMRSSDVQRSREQNITHGSPVVKTVKTPDGDVIVVSSETTRSIKKNTNAERIIETEVTTGGDYLEPVSHGYPAVKGSSPGRDSSPRYITPSSPHKPHTTEDYSTHGYPSDKSPSKTSPDYTTQGFPSARAPSSRPEKLISSYPYPDKDVIVTSETRQTSNQKTNRERIIETEVITDDGYPQHPEDFSTHGFPSVKGPSPQREISPRRGATTPRSSRPNDSYGSPRSPNKPTTDFSTHGFPSVKDTAKSPTKLTPTQPSVIKKPTTTTTMTTTTTKRTPTTEATQKLIHKEKEVDAAHRAFAASLRSSSPVDNNRRDSNHSDHNPRHTPRSSVSSTRTFRRDMREGSHDSAAPSENSRISTTTVTRQSPSKSVGKTVVTKQTVVKTRNVNGSNETIDLTPQHSTKSPSPSKTITTTTTRTTTSTKKAPSPSPTSTPTRTTSTTTTTTSTTEVPKPDNQITKPADLLFPINEPLTITKTTFTDNDASFPRNEVVEEPCLKKHYYKLGPSEITPQNSDAPATIKNSPLSQALSNVANDDYTTMTAHITDTTAEAIANAFFKSKNTPTIDKPMTLQDVNGTPEELNETHVEKHLIHANAQNPSKQNNELHEKSSYSPAPSSYKNHTHPRNRSPERDDSLEYKPDDFTNAPTSSSDTEPNDRSHLQFKPQSRKSPHATHPKDSKIEQTTVVRESTFEKNDQITHKKPLTQSDTNSEPMHSDTEPDSYQHLPTKSKPNKSSPYPRGSNIDKTELYTTTTKIVTKPKTVDGDYPKEDKPFNQPINRGKSPTKSKPHDHDKTDVFVNETTIKTTTKPKKPFDNEKPRESKTVIEPNSRDKSPTKSKPNKSSPFSRDSLVDENDVFLSETTTKTIIEPKKISDDDHPKKYKPFNEPSKRDDSPTLSKPNRSAPYPRGTNIDETETLVNETTIRTTSKPKNPFDKEKPQEKKPFNEPNSRDKTPSKSKPTKSSPFPRDSLVDETDVVLSETTTKTVTKPKKIVDDDYPRKNRPINEPNKRDDSPILSKPNRSSPYPGDSNVDETEIFVNETTIKTTTKQKKPVGNEKPRETEPFNEPYRRDKSPTKSKTNGPNEPKSKSPSPTSYPRHLNVKTEKVINDTEENTTVQTSKFDKDHYPQKRTPFDEPKGHKSNISPTYPEDKNIGVFVTNSRIKNTNDVNKEFITIEGGKSYPHNDESPDGSFISREDIPTNPNVQPTYKKKGVSQRETFEERCRHILGMEDTGDTQGVYKPYTEPDIDFVVKEDEKPKKPQKYLEPTDKTQNVTKFEVTIEDCDDDEPIYINNIREHQKTEKNKVNTVITKDVSDTNESEDTEWISRPVTTKPKEISTTRRPSSPEKRNPTAVVNEKTTIVIETRKSKSPDRQPTKPKGYVERKPLKQQLKTPEKPQSPTKILKSTADIDTSEKRTTLKTLSNTSTIKQSTKEKVSQINRPQNKTPIKSEPKEYTPKYVRKDSEPSKKQTEIRPTTKSPRKPSTESPESTIKSRLRSTTRKEAKKPNEDFDSSPETSPTRHMERRRSSNISVHTEIIIDHAGPASPVSPKDNIVDHQPRRPKATTTTTTNKKSITKDLFDNTSVLIDKQNRKLPVTERKESAPVQRVTCRDKDIKMSRSTSEDVIKMSTKPTRRPETSSLSPHSASKPDNKRPNKCVTTKTINLSGKDTIINSEDMENVIIDIQQAKSSREPSPDKIVPTPVPAELDTGKPRYPDVVQEPEDEPRKKPVVKNVPIYEEETNSYVGCHITEVNVDKSARTTDYTDYNDEILDNPIVEAPKSLDYPSIDKPDDECLLSVHEKVSKFTHTAEEIKKPKASSPFNREVDITLHVPEDDECLLTVDQKVEKFLKTAESITRSPITPSREVEKPNYDDIDEDLRRDDCTLSVSEKVNKFIDTAEKLAPTAPQKSPQLVAKIERHISRQSEPDDLNSLPDDDESLTPFSKNHTIDIEIKRQNDILSRPSVWQNRPRTTDDDTIRPDKKHDTIRKNSKPETRPGTESPIARNSPVPEPRRADSPEKVIKEISTHPDNRTSRTSKSDVYEKTKIKDVQKPDRDLPTERPSSKTSKYSTIGTTNKYPDNKSPRTSKTDLYDKPKITYESKTHKELPAERPSSKTSKYPTSENNNKYPETKSPRTSKPDLYEKTEATVEPRKKAVSSSKTTKYTSSVETTKSRFESPNTDNSSPTRYSTNKTHPVQKQEPKQSSVNKPQANQKQITKVDQLLDTETDDTEYQSTDNETEVTVVSCKNSSKVVDTLGNDIVWVTESGRPLKPKEISHSPIGSPNQSTKRTITKITERTVKPKSSAKFPDSDFVEPILEKPQHIKPTSVSTTKTKVQDTVAARRNIFEKGVAQKPVKPTTPVLTGRRPSYMDHTKSSLEHTKRDSLEINKINYTRRPSTDEDVLHLDSRPNTAVKFDVPQKVRKELNVTVTEETNIEEIFDLEILEQMLEITTSYELRRRIRAQIRLVKKNMLNIEQQQIANKTATTINKTFKSSSTYTSNVHHEETDTYSDDSHSKKPYHSPKTHSPTRSYKVPHHEKTLISTETKHTTKPHDRSHSPEGKTISSTLKEVRRVSGTHADQTNKQYITTEQVDSVFEKPRSPYTVRKSSSPEGFHRTQPHGRSQSPDDRTRIRPCVCRRSPTRSPDGQTVPRPCDCSHSPTRSDYDTEEVTVTEKKYTRKPGDQGQSPDAKTISSSLKEVRRTSGTHTETSKEYSRTEGQEFFEHTCHSPKPVRKEPMTKTGSKSPTYERSFSPENKLRKTPIYSERRHSPEIKPTRGERINSPEFKSKFTHTSEKIKKQDSFSKTTDKTVHSPERKMSKTKPTENVPIWADRKNVLKTHSTTVRKTPTTTQSTRTSSTSMRTVKSSGTQRQHHSTEEDSITSSYGIGPTDENGLPLFGIRALKKKKQPSQPTHPCETTEEVTGYVIEEKYYADDKTAPTVERKEYVYSTNPDELEDIKEKVGKLKTSRDDVVEREYQMINKEPKAIMPGSDELSTSTTKYVRRGSVKEMSEKFIRKESSQSVTEKSSSYPKAGLILRTSSRNLMGADGADDADANVEHVTTTTTTKRRVYQKPEDEDSDKAFDEIVEHSTHVIAGNESDSEETVKMRSKQSTSSRTTRSFLNSSGESKIVTGIDDVLERMRNADNVVEAGDTEDDQEARALLNKFLGASVIMRGVETAMPATKETRTITTYTDGDGDNLKKQEVRTTRVTKTIKSGSSSSPVIHTTCDLEEIWDEEILKQLLEQATTYEERRKIRARLRELMAEREEKKNLSAGEKAVLDEDESSSVSEYEEIIEEVTDYSDAETEVDQKDEALSANKENTEQTKSESKSDENVETVRKEENSEKEHKAEEKSVKEKDITTKVIEKTVEVKSNVDKEVVTTATTDKDQSTSVQNESATVSTVKNSEKGGESLMPLLQDLLHKSMPQVKTAQKAANHNSNTSNSSQISNANVNSNKTHSNTSRTSTSTSTTGRSNINNNNNNSESSSTVNNNTNTITNTNNIHTTKSTHNRREAQSQSIGKTVSTGTGTATSTSTSTSTSNSTITTMTKNDEKMKTSIGSKGTTTQVDRLSVPQKEDSGTESGEDLRLLAAGLRDTLDMDSSNTNLIEEVTAALSRLESSLREGKDISVDSSKRNALLALVARLQTGLTSPDKLAELASNLSALEGHDGNYEETSSPEADAHRSSRQRFAKRRNRNTRHTVGVSREELADARRYMEDMLLMGGVSNCTTPDSNMAPVTPPQWFPIEKNASSGAILTSPPSPLYRPNQFVPTNIKNSTECLGGTSSGVVNVNARTHNTTERRPLSGEYSVSFGPPVNYSNYNTQNDSSVQETRNTENTSPDSKSVRFSTKKQLMKRANTIDIPKTKKYNPDFDTDSESEDKKPGFGLKRTVQVNVRQRNKHVVPPFEPKTENDHKFLAFINKQSPKTGLGWNGSKSVSNWTNKFGNLKHTFEVGAAATATTGKPPQVPGHVAQNLAKNYWNKQTQQNPHNEVSLSQLQRSQYEAAERQKRLERERFERVELERLERLRLERENKERERLEREFYERELIRRQQAAAAEQAIQDIPLPKPAPMNQFIHAPQSVFRPIENNDFQPQLIVKPIPQFPAKPNTWQPPSTIVTKSTVASNAHNVSSPQFLTPKQSMNASHITSPSSTASSPVGLPWVSKPTVDNSDFKNKANKFEERSQNDNRNDNTYLQRHNSLRSPKVNRQDMDDFKKRPSLPNTTDPYQVLQAQNGPNRAYQTHMTDNYPPPPTNISIRYADYNPRSNYQSYPCLPTAINMSPVYARSREDSLTNPEALPLVLTSSNPSYNTQTPPPSSANVNSQPVRRFDYASQKTSAPTSPSLITMGPADYTDDDIDSDIMTEYRAETRVMGKPQSQTAVTIGRRTGHVSDDEVFGKNSRAAKNLLTTMKNLGGQNGQRVQKNDIRRPEPAVSPKTCLSPDGRQYQAPLVEPLFPEVTNYETDRTPKYINSNKNLPTQAHNYNTSMPIATKSNETSYYASVPSPKVQPQLPTAPVPYVSEVQTSYVVSYPADESYDETDVSNISYTKPHPTSLPLQRNRNYSENSTSSTLSHLSSSMSQNLPSPNTSWTPNPIHNNDAIVPQVQYQKQQQHQQQQQQYQQQQRQQQQPIQPAPIPKSYTTMQKPDVAPKPQIPSLNLKQQTQPTTTSQHPVLIRQKSLPTPTVQKQQQQQSQQKVAPMSPLTPTTTFKPSQSQPISTVTQKTLQQQQQHQQQVQQIQRQYPPSGSADRPKLSTRSQTINSTNQSAFEKSKVPPLTMPMQPLQSHNRVLSQQSLVTRQQQQFEERQQTAELRRKSLGNALDVQQQHQQRTITHFESQRDIKQEYKSSAPPDTPDIVKSSLPKDENMPILKKFGPPQRHHYVPNAYQNPLSNTKSQTVASSTTKHITAQTKQISTVSSTSTKTLQTEQHVVTGAHPSIVETPATPQPAEDLIPRNIVFNNVSAFTSMSQRHYDDQMEAPPRQPNRLSKCDSWNQIVQLQNQNTPLSSSPKFNASGHELRRTRSGHSLAAPKMFEAGLNKSEISEKQRTVEAYFTGKKSPNHMTSEEITQTANKRTTINRTKTSEKVSASRKSLSSMTAAAASASMTALVGGGGLIRSATMPHIANLNLLDESNVEDAFEQLIMGHQQQQQQQSSSTTEKTETKEQDGATVTTTTKVTTRTVSGAGTATKPVSPFAKFRQLDKQNSLQSPKSPSTPTTPGGSASPLFKFTDPALNARAATVKDQLLQWCQSKTREYENVQINNFSTSWSDGLAFCALIHHFLPDAFDYSKLTPQSRRHNFELAFTVADEKAGIAPLLDVEDMVEMKRPDWKCVFVYVQSIYRRFRNCQ